MEALVASVDDYYFVVTGFSYLFSTSEWNGDTQA